MNEKQRDLKHALIMRISNDVDNLKYLLSNYEDDLIKNIDGDLLNEVYKQLSNLFFNLAERTNIGKDFKI